MKEGKVVVWVAFQIAEERREAKGKGERERYNQLNAEFQRRGRRRKKAFLNEQCKEIEENNRMEKTRDLFKKIGNIKGIFYAWMGTKKGKYGKDLTEAEEIKKRWKEYTEKIYKKDLNDPDNHDVTHLEPDILECEVKWALESIAADKASRCDRIPAELFQILLKKKKRKKERKRNDTKVLHPIYQQIWKFWQ